jgi:hypothetical protein
MMIYPTMASRDLTRVAPDGSRCNHGPPLMNAGRWAVQA